VSKESNGEHASTAWKSQSNGPEDTAVERTEEQISCGMSKDFVVYTCSILAVGQNTWW
jgi:hypothetical protein